MTALPGSSGRSRQHAAEPFDVVVRETLQRRAGELRAGDQRVVGVLVEHRVVLAPEEAGDGADVGDVAGGEHERGFTAVEVGQLVLELAVEVEGAVEQAGARDPGAVLRSGALGGLDHLRVVREAEVVVGAEVDVVAALDGEAGRGRTLHRLVIGPVPELLGEVVLLQAGIRLEALLEIAHPHLTAPSNPLIP